MRVMKLRFGILQGLRFDIVVGLYAISTYLIGVMRDLLAVQLEFLDSGTQKYLSLLHGHAPQLLMMSSSATDASLLEDNDDDAPVRSTRVMNKIGEQQ